MAEYPNRSDLRNPAKLAAKAAPGQTYGEAGKQIAAQRAVPMGTPPTEQGGMAQRTSAPAPEQPMAFDRPTERPNEPITMGLASMGPQSAQQIPRFDPVLEELLTLSKMYPNPDLDALISSMQFGGF